MGQGRYDIPHPVTVAAEDNCSRRPTEFSAPTGSITDLSLCTLHAFGVRSSRAATASRGSPSRRVGHDEIGFNLIDDATDASDCDDVFGGRTITWVRANQQPLPKPLLAQLVVELGSGSSPGAPPSRVDQTRGHPLALRDDRDRFLQIRRAREL
jgi:hypothetical protein